MRKASLYFFAGLVLASIAVSVPVLAQAFGGGGGGGTMSADAILTAIETVDGPASQLDADFLDGISSSGFRQVTVMAAGVTCAAGGGASTLALDITCPAIGGVVVVPLVNSDADGCAITVAETTALTSCEAVVYLQSSAGGVVTMADVTNILDVSGSWLPAVGDSIHLVYEDLANDAWKEIGRTTAGSTLTFAGLNLAGNTFAINNSASTGGGTITTSTANASQLLLCSTGAAPACLKAQSQSVGIGTSGNRNSFETAAWLGESVTTGDGNETKLVLAYGRGGIVSTAAAVTITATTDTTSIPESTACRISSSGVSNWTPAEQDSGANAAPSGFFACCTNTGTNAITMTESAGVYEGPASASVVGQWDVVCMEYVTDRWVQRSFTDN